MSSVVKHTTGMDELPDVPNKREALDGMRVVSPEAARQAALRLGVLSGGELHVMQQLDTGRQRVVHAILAAQLGWIIAHGSAQEALVDDPTKEELEALSAHTVAKNVKHSLNALMRGA